ncbi:hypothetical protein AWB80_08148 [Caballeronia pedi]|uniref:Uncharacterized protein n=1 Tax=Caballeronia pedi TaxID=1777141 RepID=A0A158E3W5_9BURK|nr:hypothetical protein [Caballeronia pedi]SAL01539.1 hypothetical protein AWB80_08148 [Caballeronia pedi]
MNAKKAKALRKAVTLAFQKDWREVQLDGRHKRSMIAGIKKEPFIFEQRVLTKHCGRAVYRNLKNAVRKHVLINAPRATKHDIAHVESELALA